MSVQDEFKRSAENLKKAVPLMLKHKVPTTPPNYALWYTYVDQTQPMLNQAIDDAVSQFGHCPPSLNDKLYLQYIAQQNEIEFTELKTSVEKLLHELSSSMIDTLNQTSTFSNQLERNCQNLEKIEDGKLSFEEIMTLVRKMLGETQSINSSTKFLESKLNHASQEIEQLKQQLADVKHQSLIDCLTGLKNRQSFDLDIEAAQNSSMPLCLIIADVDHFKSFNDQFGHQFGDAVLKAIGNRLTSLCRDQITAYRYGGEEFALLVPNKTLPIARQFADNIRRSIDKITLKDRRSGTNVGTISASFGVAQLEKGEPVSALVERADNLMYEAKRLGRNRVMPLG
jgi:diguanylate cyclase